MLWRPHGTDSWWCLEDAGDRELRTQAHTVVSEISWSLVQDNDGPSWQACTAPFEEQSASACHHALAVTDHARTSESQWSDRRITAFRTDCTCLTVLCRNRNRVAVVDPQCDRIWTSALTDSASNDRQTRLSWRSQKKQDVLHTLVETELWCSVEILYWAHVL